MGYQATASSAEAGRPSAAFPVAPAMERTAARDRPAVRTEAAIVAIAASWAAVQASGQQVHHQYLPWVSCTSLYCKINNYKNSSFVF